MNPIIYHNPRWGKSRESVKILEKKCKSFTIIDYQKQGLTDIIISNILDILKLHPIDIIRTNESDFKNLYLSDEQLNNKKLLIDSIVEYPKIMQRPIIIYGNKGVIGRPPENINQILWW